MMEVKKKEDLDSLIENGIEENTNLEYKDPDSLKDKQELAKDVSAMANSDGGVIIYGLCEEKRDHKPSKVKWISDHQKKEKIEQVLQSSVTPKINLKINVVNNPENMDEFVLVVTVPKSDSAPHQDHFDKDKRIYWRRNGYTTRQMEHYEIEDLFFKRKRPNLKLFPKIVNSNDRTIIDLDINNDGKVLAEKSMIILKVPLDFEINGDEWTKIEEEHYFKVYQFNQNKIPFYPNLKGNVGVLATSKKKTRIEFLRFPFLIICEDMKIKEGEFLIEMDQEYVGKYKISEIIYNDQSERRGPFVKFDDFQ